VLVDTTHRYSIFTDGSFLRNGYGNGSVLAVQQLAPPQNADFDSDGDIDGADLLVWQRGATAAGGKSQGDANGDGVVNAVDLGVWRTQLGSSPTAQSALPEPSSLVIAVLGLIASHNFKRRDTEIELKANRFARVQLLLSGYIALADMPGVDARRKISG
jgi:hypothetical protein